MDSLHSSRHVLVCNTQRVCDRSAAMLSSICFVWVMPDSWHGVRAGGAAARAGARMRMCLGARGGHGRVRPTLVALLEELLRQVVVSLHALAAAVLDESRREG